MKFDIITIFPEAFSYLNESILKRARQNDLIEIKIHDLRDFTADKRRRVDDKSYGGGPGMVMRIEPIIKAVQFVKSKIKKSKIILFTPAGKQFDAKTAQRLAEEQSHLILICGHYEGIDARVEKVIKNFPPEAGQPLAEKLQIENLSIGPYVLTGGELPAMILIDAVSRHIPGVLGKKESLEEKRLGIGMPVYTRPEVFVWPSSGRNKKKKEYRVPGVLLSGNHLNINQWRAKHRKE